VERVAGIGGFFFRARDPDALNRWYAEHLGVVLPTGNYDDPGWFPDRGQTVFTAFSSDSDAFGSLEKTWKINFRVRDLDRMVRQLRAADIDVHERDYANGRFAELADPEGTRSSSRNRTRRRSRAIRALRSLEMRPPPRASDRGSVVCRAGAPSGAEVERGDASWRLSPNQRKVAR
jgi:glyoxylase I family protein